MNDDDRPQGGSGEGTRDEPNGAVGETAPGAAPGEAGPASGGMTSDTAGPGGAGGAGGAGGVAPDGEAAATQAAPGGPGPDGYRTWQGPSDRGYGPGDQPGQESTGQHAQVGQPGSVEQPGHGSTGQHAQVGQHAQAGRPAPAGQPGPAWQGPYAPGPQGRHGPAPQGPHGTAQHGAAQQGQYGTSPYGPGQTGVPSMPGAGRPYGQQAPYPHGGQVGGPAGYASGHPGPGAGQGPQTHGTQGFGPQGFGAQGFGTHGEGFAAGAPGQGGLALAAPERAPRRGVGVGMLIVIVAVAALLASALSFVAFATLYQGSPSSIVNTNQPPAAPAGSVSDVASRALPSVVSISTRTGTTQGTGSGVIISADGTIVTNNHVIALGGGDARITVMFNDQTTAPATLVGGDPVSDIAVIKVSRTGLQPITLGASANLQVGQGVIAIGSPLGLPGTVTSGIISALNRPVATSGGSDDQGSIFEAIQTDAAINPGNSGGALLNAEGSLIGINSAIKTVPGTGSGEAGSIGLGFAIPIDQAMRIAKELQDTGRATHAALGATVGGATAPTGGAPVSEVTPGGPADQAGIRAGAVITKVGDRVIGSGNALVAAIRSYRVGDKVQITYTQGGGAPRTAEVTLGRLER